MAGNKFEEKKFEDFKILSDEGTVVGWVRIKPSGLLWSKKGGHDWHGVTLDAFAQFAIENGKKQAK
jgi:hypothetical protein